MVVFATYIHWPARRCLCIRALRDRLTREKLFERPRWLRYIRDYNFVVQATKTRSFTESPRHFKVCIICINQSSFLDLENGGSHNRVRGWRNNQGFSRIDNASITEITDFNSQRKKQAHLLSDLPPALGLLPSGHQTARRSLRTGAQQSAADLFLLD